MADEVSRDWKDRSMKYYGDLTLHICQVLRSNVSRKGIPFEDIRLIAQRAIDTYDPRAKDNISIETHYWLVVHIQENPTYPKGTMTDEAWAAKRKTEGERWMVAWDRMEAAIDPNWNPEEKTYRNMTPPVETHLPSGVSPDAIKDPVLRAQYEKTIEENDKKIAHHTEQEQLRALKKQFARSLVLYFGGTYSVAPYNDAELEDLLTRHIKDAEIRSTILKAVAENKPKDKTAAK